VKYSRNREKAVIEIGQMTIQGHPVFFVRDNGVGFEMNLAGKLFAPFQRLHQEQDFEGTGIGLATVQRIVEKHRGRIWAKSEPGRGSTFFFTINAESPTSLTNQADRAVLV
jgi:light-regulated signal transduction histidine kinase (bacteriophytochrome)